MPTAGPVDQQHDLFGGLVEIADDLLDQDMDEALLGPGVGCRRVPGRWQVMGEPRQGGSIDLRAGGRGRTQVLDAAFDLGDPFQSAVPARLQFARDEPLGGVDQLVSTGREARLVARRFEIALRRGDDVVRRALDLIRSEDRGFDGAVGDGLEQLQSDGAIDPNATGADAQAGAHVPVVAAALIAMRVAFPHAVEHAHHSAAPAAAHEASQQGAPAARRFASAVALHVGVLQQELLVAPRILAT